VPARPGASALRGGLGGRKLGALWRNGGGILGGSGFFVRHGLGESFLRVNGARRFITLVDRSKRILTESVLGEGIAMKRWGPPRMPGRDCRKSSQAGDSIWGDD